MKAVRSKAPASRDIERIALNNGIRVWTERAPRSGSVALGVWVNSPSPYEHASESGATHLIQRAALKRTETRGAAAIARVVRTLGGGVSVTTERDHAPYLAHAPASKLQAAVDLLGDVTLHPALTQATIFAEQKAILAEILKAQEDLDCTVEEMFLDGLWLGRGHCRKPKGRLETTKGSTRLHAFRPNALACLHRESHHPLAITVTIAGNLRHAEAQGAAERAFGSLEAPPSTSPKLAATSRRFWATRNREQAGPICIMVGAPVCGVSDEDRHAATLLAALLADRSRKAATMGPKLIRFAHDGVLTMRVRTQPGTASKDLARAVAELKKLATTPASEAEMKRARSAEATSICRSLESADELIRDMAQQERYFSAVVDPRDECEGLERMTSQRMQGLAAGWIAPHTLSLAAIGNLGGVQMDPGLLRW